MMGASKVGSKPVCLKALENMEAGCGLFVPFGFVGHGDVPDNEAGSHLQLARW